MPAHVTRRERRGCAGCVAPSHAQVDPRILCGPDARCALDEALDVHLGVSPDLMPPRMIVADPPTKPPEITPGL